MITFAFVFLGLILGPHDVELLVEAEVAAVRLELDGRTVGEIHGEPWKIPCDFGSTLRPHKLEAIALDAEGRELSRVRQLVNLPQERAVAALMLESGDSDTGHTARLVWQHIEYETAEEISFRFDGEALASDGTDRVELPPYDPQNIHTLEAELVFLDGAHYRSQLYLGGQTMFGADAELTGVTVVSLRPFPPDLRALEGRFFSAGEPLRVVGVDKAPARVVMVVDETAIPALRALATFGTALSTAETALRQGEQLVFIFPEVKRVEGKGVPARLFAMSQPFSASHGSIPWILARVRPPQAEPSDYRRITDAIAVGALEAATGNRPRAVVLVLGNELDDTSAYSVAEMRKYLRALNVPLRVWWTGQPLSRTVSEDRRPLTVRTRWGMADDISSATRLLQATANLRQELDRQLTIWIEGSHLPGQIRLAKGVRGIRFAD